MRRRRALFALLALLCLLSACGGGGEVQERGDYVLWFLADSPAVAAEQGAFIDQGGHGPALDREDWSGGKGEPKPRELLSALLAGPTGEGRITPFPRGVTVRGCAFDEERPGVLVVRLSEQYGALTDISLTLADYCIVLTLSQLQGVEAVEIRSEGHSGNYRSHQLLSKDEAILWDEMAEEGLEG